MGKPGVCIHNCCDTPGGEENHVHGERVEGHTCVHQEEQDYVRRSPNERAPGVAGLRLKTGWIVFVGYNGRVLGVQVIGEGHKFTPEFIYMTIIKNQPILNFICVILTISNNKGGRTYQLYMAVASVSDLNAALWTALSKNQLDTCVELLDKGADVNGRNDRGCTALHMAAKRGLVEMCTLLLDRGASVLARSPKGLGPLHYAVRSGSVEVCEVLTSRGATHEPTDAGDTPLHYAAKGIHSLCALLLDRGAAIDAVNGRGETALHLACMYDRLGVCTLLLDKGAAQTETAVERQTPLHLAADVNNADMCKLLLRRGAEHLRNARGETPLHIAVAVWGLSQKCCAVLVQHGASVTCGLIHTVIGQIWGNCYDPHCDDVCDDAFEAITWLLDQGADIEERCPVGIPHIMPVTQLTPLQYAAAIGCFKLCEFLVKSGALLTPACSSGMYMPPALINQKMPVFYAARFSRSHKALSYLCNALPQETLQSVGPCLFNAVAMNTSGNADELCRALIRDRVRYADTLVDIEMSSPLLVAYETGNHKVAQLLVEFGYQYKQLDRDMGCLYYAAKKHDANAVKWLLSHGAMLTMNIQVIRKLFGHYPYLEYCRSADENYVRNSYAILSMMSQLVPFMFRHDNHELSINLNTLPVVCPQALVFFVQTLFPYLPRRSALDIIFNETYKRLVCSTSLVYESVLEIILVFSQKDTCNTSDMYYANHIIERAMYIRKEWRAARRSRRTAPNGTTTMTEVATATETDTYRCTLTCIPWFIWDRIILMLYDVPAAWLTVSYWESRSGPVPDCVGWEKDAGTYRDLLALLRS